MPMRADEGVDQEWQSVLQGKDEEARERIYKLLWLRTDMHGWFNEGIDLAFAEAEARFPGFDKSANELLALWQGIKPNVSAGSPFQDGAFTPLDFLELLWVAARHTSFMRRLKMEASLLKSLAAEPTVPVQ